MVLPKYKFILVYVTLNMFFDLSIYKAILNFIICLVWVLCRDWNTKWISAQEPRLMMGCKSLIKIVLDLGLVRPKLG
jgi:hypothetical protein